MEYEKVVKYLSDAIPQGEHPSPHTELVSVRLDVVGCSIDYIDWLEHGIAEWRNQAATKEKQATAASATARVAIGHLLAVLNVAKTHDQQTMIDAAARDWLVSIGAED